MLKESTYRKALKASWQLAWHHKVLWIFGLFAAFLGQMGLLELITRVGLVGTKYASAPSWISWDFATMGALINTLSLSLQGWLLLIWFAVLFGGIGIFLTFVSVSSQGALIDSAAQFVEEEKLPDPDTAWHSGVHHFWRLFFINLLKKGVLLVLSIVVSYAAIFAISSSPAVGVSVFTFVFLVSIFFGLIISFLSVYAACYVVVDENSLLESIKKGYKLFQNHWLVSIEIGVTILALNFLLIFLVVASMFLLFMPTLMLWLIAVTIVSEALYTVGVILATVIFLLFLAFIGSVFKVFTTSVWTYLFMKMHHHGLLSRIKHLGGLHKFEQ